MYVITTSELGNTRIGDVHGGSGALPGRVLITSATLPTQHGAHDADQRTSQNLPLPSTHHH